MIKRPYKSGGIAVYQLAKLRMLEFYYDFLGKYFGTKDFELCYMDTDSFLEMSGDSLDEIVNPEMKQACEADKKKLTCDKAVAIEKYCPHNLSPTSNLTWKKTCVCSPDS